MISSESLRVEWEAERAVGGEGIRAQWIGWKLDEKNMEISGGVIGPEERLLLEAHPRNARFANYPPLSLAHSTNRRHLMRESSLRKSVLIKWNINLSFYSGIAGVCFVAHRLSPYWKHEILVGSVDG
jgi:hypothetical protein